MEEKPLKKLHQAACQARTMSHSPYSGYAVGTALLLANDTIITGCNIENGAYTPSICGERVALFKARSESSESVVAILTVTENAAPSCGVCLQVISELAPNATLMYANQDLSILNTYQLSDLLHQPYQFTHE